jgi:SAM-dependent methyltransferase
MESRDIFEKRRIVRKYARSRGLQKPELTVLRLMRKRLANMRMLDIGVGAGRTTEFFAPVVKEYVGLDYSKRMVDSFKSRFSYEIRKGDARKLSGSFDFVLAGFNSIDYMSHEDRLLFFNGVKKVAGGGYLLFSTHNLNALPALFSFRLRWNPFRLCVNIVRFVLLRLLNQSPDELMKGDHAVVIDDDHFFRTPAHYIRPVAQVRELRRLGFTKIRLFSLSGQELKSFDESTDPWLYYLARVPR